LAFHRIFLLKNPYLWPPQIRLQYILYIDYNIFTDTNKRHK